MTFLIVFYPFASSAAAFSTRCARGNSCSPQPNLFHNAWGRTSHHRPTWASDVGEKSVPQPDMSSPLRPHFRSTLLHHFCQHIREPPSQIPCVPLPISLTLLPQSHHPCLSPWHQASLPSGSQLRRASPTSHFAFPHAHSAVLP